MEESMRDYKYPQTDTPEYAKLRQDEIKDRAAMKAEEKAKKGKKKKLRLKDRYGNIIIQNQRSAFEK